jgi:hypothetical protein
MVFGENPLIPVQFRVRVNQFAFVSSPSQIASRIEPGDLFVFQPSNATQIHLGIGMGFLCNVSPNSAQKGFSKYYNPECWVKIIKSVKRHFTHNP